MFEKKNGHNYPGPQQHDPMWALSRDSEPRSEHRWNQHCSPSPPDARNVGRVPGWLVGLWPSWWQQECSQDPSEQQAHQPLRCMVGSRFQHEDHQNNIAHSRLIKKQINRNEVSLEKNKTTIQKKTNMVKFRYWLWGFARSKMPTGAWGRQSGVQRSRSVENLLKQAPPPWK